MQLTQARAAEAKNEISQGANEAGRLADNLQRAASAASSIDTGGVSSGGGGGSGGFGSGRNVRHFFKLDTCL